MTDSNAYTVYMLFVSTVPKENALKIFDVLKKKTKKPEIHGGVCLLGTIINKTLIISLLKEITHHKN